MGGEIEKARECLTGKGLKMQARELGIPPENNRRHRWFLSKAIWLKFLRLQVLRNPAGGQTLSPDGRCDQTP